MQRGGIESFTASFLDSAKRHRGFRPISLFTAGMIPERHTEHRPGIGERNSFRQRPGNG